MSIRFHSTPSGQASTVASNARRRVPVQPARVSGFTMIEIALCLAIIGFAMVAIIGVLPMGLTVQRDNREDTIINQDATYLIEGIRSGAQGMDDLTNHVDRITIAGPSGINVYTYGPNAGQYATGRRIIELLSTPKYQPLGSNLVTAEIRAISGPLAEKGGGAITNLSFKYRLTTEIIPFLGSPIDLTDTNSVIQAQKLAGNLHEMRLIFQWPLLPTGRTGPGRQVYRLLVSGLLEAQVSGSGTNYLFKPQIYQ